jgi:hypothetical protein
MNTAGVRSASMVLAIILVASGPLTKAACAQEEPTGGSSAHVIHQGNTYIIFERAGTVGLPMERYRAFDEFAAEHPDIVEALTKNPRIMTDEHYLKAHPALEGFFQKHPDVRTDFANNPGNYVDMPLAVAAALKQRPIELP